MKVTEVYAYVCSDGFMFRSGFRGLAYYLSMPSGRREYFENVEDLEVGKKLYPQYSVGRIRTLPRLSTPSNR